MAGSGEPRLLVTVALPVVNLLVESGGTTAERRSERAGQDLGMDSERPATMKEDRWKIVEVEELAGLEQTDVLIQWGLVSRETWRLPGLNSSALNQWGEGLPEQLGLASRNCYLIVRCNTCGGPHKQKRGGAYCSGSHKALD